MSMIQLTSAVSVNELVDGLERLSTPDLEEIVSKVLALQAKRRASSLPKSETELLQKINQGIPINVQTRFDELNKKRSEETLTDAEHRELLVLIEEIEQADVQRINYLSQLAQLRNVSVRELIKQ
ncbi:MAG: hypothetical protein R3A44_26580 [Caldilineaceae bacterium]